MIFNPNYPRFVLTILAKQGDRKTQLLAMMYLKAQNQFESLNTNTTAQMPLHIAPVLLFGDKGPGKRLKA